ncbi:hypothetical protein CW306_10080 [Bacillus sp. BA3]|nr:hypothetical protein CW306_10080 [Bacillus sp. BA3]
MNSRLLKRSDSTKSIKPIIKQINLLFQTVAKFEESGFAYSFFLKKVAVDFIILKNIVLF